MAINDVAGERVYHVLEFLSHDFVSSLGTLKPLKTFKNFKKPKN